MLLIVGGLFVRSLENAQHMDLGFDAHHVLILSTDVREAGYDIAHGAQFYRDLIRRIRAVPGVVSAALSFSVPFRHANHYTAIYVEGRSPAPSQHVPGINYNTVDSSYFDTLRTPILHGRAFAESDNVSAPRVAIVNQAMADQLWPNQDPVGKRFRMGSLNAAPVEVVGVARNAKYVNPTHDWPAYFYIPLEQRYEALRFLQIRSSLPPEALLPEVKRLISSLAPTLPVTQVRTMEEELQAANGFFLFHVGAGAAGGLGTLGLFLALIGVYGVVSYTASLRTHEIAIRMALGAQQRDIVGMILREGLVLAGLGIALGLIATIAVARVMTSLLLDVAGTDPLTITMATLVLGSAALMACLIPARRATRVGPIVALRYE